MNFTRSTRGFARRFTQRHLRGTYSSHLPSQRWRLLDSSSSSSTSSSLRSLILGARSIWEVRQTHARALVLGLLHQSPSPFFASALILTYSSLLDAHSSILIFRISPDSDNPFLHNTLVRALSNSSLFSDAIAIYNLMLRDGLRPDDRTFPYVLKACADFGDLSKGMEVHGSVTKHGFFSDVYVANTLLALYASSGSLTLARGVFDEISCRDIVSWNSMISACSSNGCYVEALRFFLELMREKCLSLNLVSLVSALTACSASHVDAFVFGKSIHGLSVKNGLDCHATLANAFVDFYGKCSDLVSSMSIFWTVSERNDITWNSIIGSLSHAGFFTEAVGMFKNMLMDHLKKPNSITISSLLPSLVEPEHFNLAREIHGFVIKAGMDTDSFVANSLMDIYAKHGCRRKASDIFYRIKKKNTVSWNAMVANLTLNGSEAEAISLVGEMVFSGEAPNVVTFVNVLPACSRILSLEKGKEIHAKSIRCGFNCNLFVSNALIDMYSKCNKLQFARRIFEQLDDLKDQVSYNALIIGYSRSSYSCVQSLILLTEMMSVGFSTDAVSFMGALAACGNMSAVKQGKEIHGFSVKKMLDFSLSNSVLDMYVKCGEIDIARKVFDRIHSKDVASWNSMIIGYGSQGQFHMATEFFDKMAEGDESLVPDHVSYVAVLWACSHAGLVEKGWGYYKVMLDRGIRPTQTHYACMVDLLGRAGMVDEAAEFVKKIPFLANSDVWGSLLGAARLHGSFEWGRKAAEHLFKQKQSSREYYVLLANMYGEAGRWKEANETRQLLEPPELVKKKKKKMREPGCSWISVL